MLQSAVRPSTPPPGGAYEVPYNSRKRSASPRSRSPDGRRSPKHPRLDERSDRRNFDSEAERITERFREQRLGRPAFKPAPEPPTAEAKEKAARDEYTALLSKRSGGVYLAPARLRALQAQITDKSSNEYQRMAWEALKKSINGLVNKVNVSNVKSILPEIFNENLIRGRGLFCRSIMKAQAQAIPFTPVYAAMVAIVNTKLPTVGELLMGRLITQFRKAFRRNDKAVCLSSTTFLAHAANFQIIHETTVAQALLLLLKNPTNDSVEIAVNLTRECGAHLEEMNPAIANAIYDEFRRLLHDSDLENRTQYMIEVIFQIRKDKYRDHPAVKEELDLVEEEDMITHRISLDDEINTQDSLNVFKYDPEYEESEEKYKALKAEILGEADGDDSEYESGSSSEGEEAAEERTLEIKDQTNTDLVNLRRTIYLTIMSSSQAEEACHKLMKLSLPAGQESELCSMIIECNSQSRTYEKFYGLIGERFAKINRLWSDLFQESFSTTSSEAIPWHVLSVIHLNEEETTSSSRIFIKILFQDLAEALGMKTLQTRLKDEILRPAFEGIFPMDEPRNTRFAINYFTSIGMGGLTEEMRTHLQNVPKPALFFLFVIYRIVKVIFEITFTIKISPSTSPPVQSQQISHSSKAGRW
ncbi:pre-mRNA-splicing factor CWC22, partial [Lecanoromycetidae sp. Uapishka_2]